MDHNRGVKRSKKENNKLMLDSLQWHYDPLSREFWHQKQRVYTLSLDCYDEKSWMNCCLLKVPKYFPLSFPTVYWFLLCRKQTTLQQKAALLQRVQRDCLLPVCLHTEKVGLGFVTVCPCCLCHFNPKDWVYISSALKPRGKIYCSLSHPSRYKSIYRIAKVSSFALSSRED